MRKKKIKGYKVFNSDWTCKGFKYKVGEEYKMDDDIEVCKRGFHFCSKLVDCFEFYAFDAKNKVAEIEALGVIKNKKGDIKSVTNHIKIVKELSWPEVCEMVNTGYYNSGNRNSGYCNSGDYNSGIFINNNLPIYAFNKKTNLTMAELKEKYQKALDVIIYGVFPLTKWVSREYMTDEEKEKHPFYETTGGYLRTNTYKQAWAETWKNYTKKEKQAIQQLPNFDKKIFEDITGITIKKDEC